jgi:ribosome silencing factor RsfS/YbeB/iojap
LATSEKRDRPRKAAVAVAAKAPAAGRKVPSASKKAAPRKSPAATGKAKSAAANGPQPVSKAPKVARTRSKPARAPDLSEQLRTLVLAALDDLKARDITEVDVRGKSNVTDLMVVASGTSSRHVKSIAEEVVKRAKQAGVPPIGVEGQREAEWVLVDLGDVVVHVMLPRTREFYGLERLWTVGDESQEALAG